MHRCLPILVGSLLSLYSDKNPTEPVNGELMAETDKELYAPNEQVVFSIYNGRSSAVYFGHCGERIVFSVEQKESDAWVGGAGGWGMPCPAVYLMGTICVESETSYSDSLVLPVAGVYRMMFTYGWRQEDTWADTLLSNEFSVM